jgi:adenylate kinase
MLGKVKRKLDHVLVLEVDDKALVDRIKGRAAETGGARTDDNEETLKKRLKVYHDQTAPILPYYQAKSLLRAIDGMKPVDEVTALIGKTLK